MYSRGSGAEFLHRQNDDEVVAGLMILQLWPVTIELGAVPVEV
jgi:hypothetical protein